MAKIKKLSQQDIEDIFALTPLQEGMLFHYLQDPKGDQYFEQLCLNISGGIDIEVFEQAWNSVIDTNEMLRTVFRWENVKNPIQIVLKEYLLQPRYYDFSGKDRTERKMLLDEIKTRDRNEKFDLQDVPFRVTLGKTSENQYELMVSHHHILYDGWSSGIILKEFFTTYNDLFNQKKPEKVIKNKFKEFVKWRQPPDTEKQEKFWKDYLMGFDSRSEFSIKKSKGDGPDEGIYRAENYQFKFDRHLQGKLESFVREQNITAAALLYAAWGILLQRYNDHDDELFGITVSGRSAKVEGIEQMVGLFINTLPFRVKSRSYEEIRALLGKIHGSLQSLGEFEITSLLDIKECSELDNRDEPFDTLVVVENYPLANDLKQKRGPLSVDSFSIFEMTHYDLTLLVPVFDEIEINFIYPAGLFDRETIRDLACHYRNVVEYIIRHPDGKVIEIEMLSAEEKNKLLREFNKTEAEFPADKTIYELFAHQVERTPDHISVVGEGLRLDICHISYQELNTRANQLAGYLIERGVKADSIVGIMLERSIEMVIGIMGILKAGGAYLPIDPDYPQERIDFMLKDSEAQVLVITSTFAGEVEKLRSWEVEKVFLEEILETPASSSQPLNLSTSQLLSSSNLAYVIYTSGSTGKPKGVLVEQRSVINRIRWMQKKYPLTGEDIILQKTPFTFDVSVWELFWWAFAGAKIYLLTPGGEKDPGVIADAVENGKVTVMHFVPSMLQVMLEFVEKTGIQPGLKKLKQVFASGEKLGVHQVVKFKNLLFRHNKTKLTNLYGPTEATVDVSYFDCCPGTTMDIVPIGKPIDNIGLYIMDYAGHLQPIGVPGELSISGVGLARGYLNNPGLTAERFVLAHSSWLIADRKEKKVSSFGELPMSYELSAMNCFYRTGDLACWLPDGNIEFLGRIDHQVKIRGYRIELGEIESQLLRHHQIKEALVIARENEEGDKSLCAYIVSHLPESSNPLNVTELREFLSNSLPDYMIPAFFMEVKEIPLTVNGKVDRKALLSLGVSMESGREYAAPESDLEKKMTAIWQQVLGVEKVGIDDNFFDLGGNSFYIIRLASQLKQEFKRDFPVVTLFRYPTVRSLLKFFQAGDTGETTTARTQTGKEDTHAGADGEMGVEIGVIGMAGRFPGAKNIDEFWKNLKNGIESITFFTDEEVAEAEGKNWLARNPNYVKAKGVLEGSEYFDSTFFSYIKNEAAVMDPQVRVFHECCWEALEHAGYVPDNYEGKIGLFAGATPNFYWEALTMLSGGKTDSFLELWDALQFSEKDYLTTRISYKLNLNGPAVAVQTACSTSLVAIDMACQGLLTGKCDIALAGGVSITVHDRTGYLYQEGMIMSPDGHCRAFDDRAKGTVNGNGAGVVVLKRLGEAVGDRDTIHAVIKGSAVNNDGIRKVGFTAPSVEGQAEVIRAAMEMARVNPESISCVETHGTGTILGDPIEMEGLKLAFNIKQRGFCAIGSVKTNIGHLDAAAGVAGFIKTVLALKHRCIPPILNFKTPNAKIDFENSPFYVNTGLKDWKNDKYPLRAGINSFGFGGTNAHVILEEWPGDRRSEGQGTGGQKNDGEKVNSPQLIILSAKTGTALDKMTENLAKYLKENHDNPENPANPGANSGFNLANAAYTLQVGRKAFEYRRMLVCSHVDEAVHILSSLDAEKLQSFVARKEDRPVVFMFPGQGSQYVGMARGLYENEPVFRREIDRCFETPMLGDPIKKILYPPETGDLHLLPDINRTEIAQPVIFIIEYALARLLMEWGIMPYAMIGHSIGEYTAACLSGVFSLENALELVTLRGRLMQQMPAGSMLSVPLPEQEIRPLLDRDISLAAVNTPGSCVVSGTHQAIDAFAEQLMEKEIKTRRLHTSHAFHSPMMDPVLDEFEKKVRQIKMEEPQIPYISNLSGNWITIKGVTDPLYWPMHLRRTVRFADGLQVLLNKRDLILLEVGPGSALSTFTRQHPAREAGHLVLDLVRHVKEEVDDNEFLLRKLGQLWLYGKEPDWRKFYPGEKRQRIPLPSYPFESKHCVIDKNQFEKVNNTFFESLQSPKKTDISDWFYIPSWKRRPLVFGNLQAREKPGKSCWLLFINEGSMVRQMVRQLKMDGYHVITVSIGPGFSLEDADEYTYTINPRQDQDYEALFNDLRLKGKTPHKIIHLWNVREGDEGEPGIEAIEKSLDLGFFSLIFLVRELGMPEGMDAVEIDVLTNNMQEVTGGDLLCPLKAALLGALKVIPHEYPRVKYRSIDIELSEPGSQQEKRLVGQVVEEISEESTDSVVAYRNGIRWVQTFEPVRLDETFNGTSRLREKGVYLISGGLGSMGLVLAKHLSRSVKARLVLLSRSPLPGRERWEEWLSSRDTEDRVSRKIRQLQEIEELGAEIMVVAADVSDQEQIKEAVRQIQDRFGRLDGVIHAAGVADQGGVIQRRTRETTEPVLAAKMKGTLLLDRLIKDFAPDFFILCSSITSVLGNFSEVGYAAANAFLDAFAQFRNSRDGVFTLSINWDTWQEVGMAVEAVERLAGSLDISLDEGILSAEGVEVWNRALGSNLSRVVVSTIDLESRQERVNTKQPDGASLLEAFLETAKPGTLHQRPEMTTAYVPPGNDTEKKLAQIWQEFFGIEQIGIHDSFFELGGDSLKAAVVSAKIHQVLNTQVSLKHFFAFPTIKGLASYIYEDQGSAYSSIECVEKKDYYLLASAQERMFILNQLDKEGIGYNIPTICELEGRLDVEKVTAVFKKLIRSQESLRTSFYQVDGETVQKVHDHVEFKIEYYDMTEIEEKAADTVNNFIRPFDLSRAPLLRVGLIRQADVRHLLLLDMHHIIADGSSMGILVEGLMKLYEGGELPDLKLTYKDYVEWLRNEQNSTAVREQEKYWLEELKGPLPVLNLPLDFPRPPLQTFEGRQEHFELGAGETRSLKKLAKEEDTTLYMVLLSIYTILLAKISGQEDILIGTPTAGRNHADLQNLNGMFVNTVVLRNYPGGEKTYRQFLEELKERTLAAFENQDYPFEDLPERIGAARDVSRNPLFDAAFVLENMQVPEIKIPGLNLKPYPYETRIAKFDITLFAWEGEERLFFVFEYSTRLFKEETITRLIGYFREIVTFVVGDRNIKLQDIEVSHHLLRSKLDNPSMELAF
ncbi:MAG: amino acid adenylation domain-containing protein [Candidatus Aminicenantes bacterium]|nr:amino acid adenylation domain-containing protein [Candidatus Aminicenantes bacterium]NIM81243.1 amino acid adenylation domain-containing protein [Candidatus Aminicenantes bacterium]NIN18906.1 amino acid adenylation domain-containing protein [Candidatus Aminicenantes bacterium]NIN42816.1 amino acid adenylation domain-containing protein [Candidatus Aminicenantes bacterium]NIN85543.1 amino acid adenylation domain-containing protein [Candidatus Aminicenantes bacterium]